jgi:dTDP-4-dehydrorhamnose reductase
MRIVQDQYGCPTWCRLLAEITTQALAQGRHDPAGWVRQTAGLYHLAGDGFTNRFEWAREILTLDPRPQEQQVESLVPAASSEFPTPAQRPLYVPLNCERFTQTFNLRLPPWEHALQLLLRAE